MEATPTPEATQSKKQLKKQAKEAEWNAKKALLKKAKKEKHKEKKRLQRAALQKKREAGEEITPEELGKYARPRRGRGFKQELRSKLQNAPSVIIDCSFDQHHGQKELLSMARQLEHCLNLNKKFSAPIKIMLTGLSTQMEDVIKQRNGQNWPVEIKKDHDFKQLFPNVEDYQKLVYLTGDCDVDMTDYDSSKIYIIGGIVDHNKLKNLTAGKAASLGIPMARFPLNQYISLKTSAILSINHSFEILVRKYNGQSWEETVKASIPERKREQQTAESQEASESSPENSEDDSEEEEQRADDTAPPTD